MLQRKHKVLKKNLALDVKIIKNFDKKSKNPKIS